MTASVRVFMRLNEFTPQGQNGGVLDRRIGLQFRDDELGVRQPTP